MADSALSRSNIRRISPLREGQTSSRGSGIQTAGQRMAAEDAMNTTQRGILELRRRQMMGQGAAGTPATGSSFGRERIPGKPTIIGSAGPALRGAEEELWSKPGVRPEGSTDGGNVWITPGGGVVNKDARDPNTYSYNKETGRVLGTAMAWDKGDGQFGMYSNGSSAPAATSPAAPPAATTQRPAPAPLLARPRQGVIDGKPAGQVLSGMRENATRGTTPAQTYGADVAKRNIAERGPQAAIEDYFNRNRLDAQRAPMPTEPGSMAERRATAEKNQTRPNAIGPAQRAMLDARQSREDRAKRDSEDQRNYDTLRARDITENVGYRLGRNAATTDDVINKNLSFADRRDQLQSERGYKDNDVTDNLVSEALRSNPANPPEFFKDFTGESERYSKETGARGLAGARADAAGSRVLRTPAVSADMDFRTALRDQPTQRAMRGEVTPVTPLGREKPPALARPRPQAPAAEAPAPALVQRTNALADRLRARANTPYQQRMTEGAVTIEDMVRSAGGVARTLAGLPEKARQFSNRTNQWAENFRNSR